ncbi:hypothetical protein WN51_00878 [Melipona quadrifasciata]|uniref:Uncharacterized protein n=1 Tax=Melipona quadrifasciata TaxID=166423 RepID=A0A0M9AB99_9HYME|nr:hypothetical protein WN51_00878 [Melipona quadrifasciata]
MVFLCREGKWNRSLSTCGAGSVSVSPDKGAKVSPLFDDLNRCRFQVWDQVSPQPRPVLFGTGICHLLRFAQPLFFSSVGKPVRRLARESHRDRETVSTEPCEVPASLTQREIGPFGARFGDNQSEL